MDLSHFITIHFICYCHLTTGSFFSKVKHIFNSFPVVGFIYPSTPSFFWPVVQKHPLCMMSSSWGNMCVQCDVNCLFSTEYTMFAKNKTLASSNQGKFLHVCRSVSMVVFHWLSCCHSSTTHDLRSSFRPLRAPWEAENLLSLWQLLEANVVFLLT